MDTESLAKFIRPKIIFQELVPGENPALKFSHMMHGGYASVYFSYLYSVVYARDLFTEFEKHGIMSKKIGQRYRKYILEPCGLNSGFDKLRNFLDREPNEDAYMSA